ncbi:single-stranded DNA-binding protein [Lacticaseibacillus parakribbianus]|uniref:single-stranded DNA-binding protein n=1 Tax=Lacticaseibacillus parakribbianus TaxID=2970927 RepID=UPI0021CB496B|nr:single-stranded DNA-binding protein [Lacticaseibacillus parakribbianus]
MINNVSLTGRLTRDIELKYTQSGTAVGSFTLAVDRSFKNANGEREADFINCVIWRKSAENLSNFTRKGSLIGIEGRIQTRNYDNNQGQKVYVTEVVVDNFALLESKNQQAAPASQPSAAPSAQPVAATTAPAQSTGWAATATAAANPFAGAAAAISDDDLPF